MIVLPRRLSDEVADRVRALIDEKNLEAGMKLPAERQLAMQLGVSRNSLREALAKLVSEGVLLSRRGGGTFIRWRHDTWSEQNIVQPLKTLMADDPDYSFDILEARYAIEASTAYKRTFVFIWRLPKPHITSCCCKPCAVSSMSCNPQ